MDDFAMDNYATRPDEHTVQFVRILPGPIERIWEYLWDGKKRGEWFASGAMPAKPGESFEMHFKHSTLSPNQAPPPEKFIEMDKTGHQSRNVLLAYEPPHRLVFSFGPDARKDSEVEFRLNQEGDPKDNKVRLTLTHSKIPDRGNMPWACRAAGTAIWPSCNTSAEGKMPPAFWDIWRRKTDEMFTKERICGM